MTNAERELLLELAQTIVQYIERHDREFPIGYQWEIRALIDDVKTQAET